MTKPVGAIELLRGNEKDVSISVMPDVVCISSLVGRNTDCADAVCAIWVQGGQCEWVSHGHKEAYHTFYEIHLIHDTVTELLLSF